MRVIRGTAPTPGTDRAATATLLDRVAADGEQRLRIWQPPRHVAFGRQDSAADGYERARAVARDHGYEPVERSVGGRAVAHTGTTVAFAYGVAAEQTIQTRYRAVTGLLKRALRSLGVDTQRGEPDEAFCPGAHSLQNRGKLVGIAQRVRRDAALVAGCVVVRRADETAIAAVLDPVYTALSVPFDPESVGSVEGAGGPGEPERTIEVIGAAVRGSAEFETAEVDVLLG
jgi:lipoate-protein ligase A